MNNDNGPETQIHDRFSFQKHFKGGETAIRKSNTQEEIGLIQNASLFIKSGNMLGKSVKNVNDEPCP